MFVRSFADVPVPFAEAERRLLASPTNWITGLAREAEDGGERLLVEVGFPIEGERRVKKEVEVEIGMPHRTDSATRLPLTWKATGPRSLFPSLEADLEVAALGPERTQVSVSATYRPPFGAFGRRLDRTLLHRVAEATIKDFVDRVSEALSEARPTETVAQA